MPIRIRFTGPTTLNSILSLSWLDGFPPSSTATASQTFKTIRSATKQTTIGSTDITQATNYYNAMVLDYSSNFIITQIGPDVIINTKNGMAISATATSLTNIQINPVTDLIQFIGQPEQFVPVYNPITYKFFSPNYSISGFRYIVNLYNTSNEKIYSAKVTPQEDGTGYIDISKPLSNFTSVDWDRSLSSVSNCINSYVSSDVRFGYEYQVNWLFNQIVTATNSNNCRLIQSPSTTPHTYVVGDQLNITTTLALTDPLAVVNGLHTVLYVPNSYSIVIDAIKPTTGTFSTSGIISYADGRKTSFTDLIQINSLAFNGARRWVDFPNYSSDLYYFAYNNDVQLLTSLRISSETYFSEDDYFYITPTQALWFNFATAYPNDTFYLSYNLNNDITTLYSNEILISDGTGNEGPVKQFKISLEDLISTEDPIYNDTANIQFRVVDDGGQSVSRWYRVYLDRRCKIENYELYYMDRMGSILSFACQLRAKETGTITREMGKQQVYYNEGVSDYSGVYNTTDRGMSINSVNLSKDLELNTNWMNNEMSLMFEELLTSPFVWLKTVVDATPQEAEKIIYTSVTVNETSFEVQKQKNKRLIRKTVTVKSANEDIINI